MNYNYAVLNNEFHYFQQMNLLSKYLFFECLLQPNFVNVHLRKLDNYINEVINGEVIANKCELFAIQSFLHHKTKYIYKESEVIKAVKLFSLLNIQIKNDVKQVEIMPFQMLLLSSILGMYKNENTVLYPRSFILVAKKY